ncbi:MULTISPECIES: hypothetical protein [Streptomyces]|uniref:Uncharacterized protein n=1 Tax=Streptomyces antimycoticus TaxID=68175 RepID=A0ABD5JQI3_9ACTN|nr:MULTISPECIES: hypothetical protein [unclassified Streptomyces]MEE4590016.1 hypothetical protein [Streptomyces sp. DSM 41602]QTI87314.1 hypothetical protein AS97_40280 [Streptomyces sp. AgN23]WTA78610.1 hypothetical protein OG751_00485 [Streptomyces antimycoticus]WTB02861.1 hypothetical protein OG546_00430 [Streptomyces antimycoticus]
MDAIDDTAQEAWAVADLAENFGRFLKSHRAGFGELPSCNCWRITDR